MSIQIASEYTARSIIDYRTGSDGLADEWIELADHQHRVFEKDVSELGGHIFDPPALVNVGTTSFGTNNARTGGRDADELNLGGVVERECANTDVLLLWSTYGVQVDIRLEIINEESGTSLTTVTNNHGSSHAWIHKGIALPASDVKSSGNGQYLSGRVTWSEADDTVDSEVFMVRLGGDYDLEPADLPTADATP